MKFFYSILLFFVRFDLAIAKATGRNPKNIAQLQREESMYERELIMMDLNS